MSKKNRPSVFVGSTTEALDVVRGIQSNLAEECEVVPWKQMPFPTGRFTLESLVQNLGKYDFALLVLTSQDYAESKRSLRRHCPRDNVFIELGLSIGLLGRKRTFVVCESAVRSMIPSDMAGVTVADYRAPKSGNVNSALGPACNRVLETIRELGPRTKRKTGRTRRERPRELVVPPSQSSDAAAAPAAAEPSTRQGEGAALPSKQRFLLFRNGYVKVPHDSSLEPRDITVEAWVYAVPGSGRNACLVRKAAHFKPGYILRWQQDSQGRVQFRLDRRAPERTVAAEGPAIADLLERWVHLAGTYDSETGLVRLFVNGRRTAETRTPITGLHHSQDHLTIGGSPNAPEGEAFSGLIRSVRITSKVRYVEDFTPTLEPPASSAVGAHVVLYMPLDEGEGDQVSDMARGLVGQIVNAQWVEPPGGRR